MIIVALPVYDEEKNLEPLVKDISKTLGKTDYRIVVVDDGSRDRTPKILAELAASLPLTVETHETNKGLGQTLLDCLRRATELAGAGDVVVTMDADQSHDPAYIPAMIAELDKGADIIIASRFAPGGGQEGVSPLRRMLSRGSGTLLKLLFPIAGVRDYTTGYRAYRSSALKQAFDRYGSNFITETGFSASPEILLKLAGLGLNISEIPFTLRYGLKKSYSKIKIGRTIGQYLQMMLRLRRQLGPLSSR